CDARVGATEMLVVALIDHAHAFCNGTILAAAGSDPRITAAAAVRSLQVAVDEVVVALVAGGPEAAKPVRPVIDRVIRPARGDAVYHRVVDAEAYSRPNAANAPTHAMLVVHRNDAEHGAPGAGGRHHVERVKELRDAPIGGVSLC